MVYEEGSFVQRYVYGADGARLSMELSRADGTKRGEPGENIASDIAVDDIQKIWYRRSLLDSSLFALDADGEVVTHTIYDPWGKPLTTANLDINFAGIDNITNFTGYTMYEYMLLTSGVGYASIPTAGVAAKVVTVVAPEIVALIAQGIAA